MIIYFISNWFIQGLIKIVIHCHISTAKFNWFMTKWLCIEEIDNYPNYKYWKNDSAYYKYFPHN